MQVPVVSKVGKPLMPTKPSRARRWLKEGKAVKRRSNVGMFYSQLIVEIGKATQPIAVRVDPGKKCSGIAIRSTRASLFQLHLVLPFDTVRFSMKQRQIIHRWGQFSAGKVSLMARNTGLLVSDSRPRLICTEVGLSWR
ncbi:RRXRR domain-containing protein [Oxynema sp. CENA135]|uniref:RRXRR domain-containing protein n=1 Tax=Oxynema sp. CENA135 TaxID=984206 RepID=UPI00190CEC3D|nr:RRXRR domain-containing protein [Oxynema sp. CENA135]MBK4732167.1 RRXRR domain-containing protein [Oxynema sp. CENA135]